MARDAGSAVILWDRDAAVSPLESPLPTDWSGDGEQEQFGDRLGPNDLIAAGREALARQVGQLRQDGIDAWGWLPSRTEAEDLARYAEDTYAALSPRQQTLARELLRRLITADGTSAPTRRDAG